MNCRQQQRDQHTDDRDDDQEFYGVKAGLAARRGPVMAQRSRDCVAMLGCYLISIPERGAAHYSDEQQQNTGRLWDGIAAECRTTRRLRLAEVRSPVGVIRRIHHAGRTVVR